MLEYPAWGRRVVTCSASCCLRTVAKKVPPSAAAGTLLRALAFPVSLHALALGPGEHALYAGGGDGRVFEVALAGQEGGGASSGASGVGTPNLDASNRGWVPLEGHARTVTCLATTTDGGYLLSGGLSYFGAPSCPPALGRPALHGNYRQCCLHHCALCLPAVCRKAMSRRAQTQHRCALSISSCACMQV